MSRLSKVWSTSSTVVEFCWQHDRGRGDILSPVFGTKFQMRVRLFWMYMNFLVNQCWIGGRKHSCKKNSSIRPVVSIRMDGQTDGQTQKPWLLSSIALAQRGAIKKPVITAQQFRLMFSRENSRDKCNKSVLSLDPRLSTWRYPHLLVSAGCRRTSYRSICATEDRAQQQTRRPALVSIDETGKRMANERTDTRPLLKPCSDPHRPTVRTASKSAAKMFRNL